MQLKCYFCKRADERRVHAAAAGCHLAEAEDWMVGGGAVYVCTGSEWTDRMGSISNNIL